MFLPPLASTATARLVAPAGKTVVFAVFQKDTLDYQLFQGRAPTPQSARSMLLGPLTSACMEKAPQLRVDGTNVPNAGAAPDIVTGACAAVIVCVCACMRACALCVCVCVCACVCVCVLECDFWRVRMGVRSHACVGKVVHAYAHADASRLVRTGVHLCVLRAHARVCVCVCCCGTLQEAI